MHHSPPSEHPKSGQEMQPHNIFDLRFLSTVSPWMFLTGWTGSEMIVWGGVVFVTGANTAAQMLADGARYDPATDRWTPITTNGAPPAAASAVSAWTGKE